MSKEEKEKFKESIIRQILKNSMEEIDERFFFPEDFDYENIEHIKEIDENGNYIFIIDMLKAYTELKSEEIQVGLGDLEKIDVGIKDLEKYLELNISDFLKLRSLEVKFRDNFKAKQKEI